MHAIGLGRLLSRQRWTEVGIAVAYQINRHVPATTLGELVS
jgi:hypothetical protein